MSRVLTNCLANRESIEMIRLVLLVVILFRLLLCSGEIHVVSKVDTKSNKNVLTTYLMMYLLGKTFKTVAANVVFLCGWDESYITPGKYSCFS